MHIDRQKFLEKALGSSRPDIDQRQIRTVVFVIVPLEGIFNASHTACQIRIDEFRNMPEWHGRYTDHETIVNVQFRSYLDSFFPNKKNKYYDIDYEIEEERERDEWR